MGRGPEQPRLEQLAVASGGGTNGHVEFLGWRSDEEVRELYQRASAVLLPGIEDFGMVPVEAQACGTPVVALGTGGACETVQHGVTGILVDHESVEAFANGIDQCQRRHFDREAIRAARRFSGSVSSAISRASSRRQWAPLGAPIKPAADRPRSARHDAPVQLAARRLLRHLDLLLGAAAFTLAYLLRFETLIAELIPVTKGKPPFGQDVDMLPFIGVLVPIAFQVQGLYRLRRGRSRVDDFFAVFVGSILAVVLGIIGTLVFQTYYVPQELKD